MSTFVSFTGAMLSAISQFLSSEPIIYIVMMVIIAFCARIIKNLI